MSVELKIPEVGESITEVQVGRWLKTAGDHADQDEGIVEIETDKVSFEIPAPVSGKVVTVLKAEGEAARVGDVIGYMEASEAPAPSGEAPATSAPAPAEAPAAAPAERPAAPVEREMSEEERLDTVRRVMPAARRALADHGLRADEVEGSGPGGRVLKEDVERHVRDREDLQHAEKSTAASAGAGGAREEEVVPMSPLRKRLAERLVAAQQGAALLTTFNEIDMGAVMALRKEHGEAFLGKHGVKLGFMSFFVKGVIEGLKEIPALNAEIRGDDIVYRNYFDIGVAVGGGKGLVVPVLRNTERMSFAEIEKAIADLAERARKNRLELSDLTGGTFTISNGGIYGSLLSTPIVNPPQSGILGLHAIQDRPVGRDGQVVLRPMMYVAVTYDHRVVDGREAVTFLRRVKDCLEAPARMLLEV